MSKNPLVALSDLPKAYFSISQWTSYEVLSHHAGVLVICTCYPRKYSLLLYFIAQGNATFFWNYFFLWISIVMFQMCLWDGISKIIHSVIGLAKVFALMLLFLWPGWDSSLIMSSSGGEAQREIIRHSPTELIPAVKWLLRSSGTKERSP